MRLSQMDSIHGGLLRLLVGDALGVPYEFRPAHQLPGKELLEMEPQATFLRAYRGVPPGTWSDNGAGLLCATIEVNMRIYLGPEHTPAKASSEPIPPSPLL